MERRKRDATEQKERGRDRDNKFKKRKDMIICAEEKPLTEK
jgi:hypothetical protein